MAEPTSNPLLNLGLQAAEVLRQRLSQPAPEPVVQVQVTVEDPPEPEPESVVASSSDELSARLGAITERLRQLEAKLLP